MANNFFIVTLYLYIVAIVTIVLASQNSSRNEESVKLPPYQVYYQWKKGDYEFESKEERARQIKSKEFIQKNVIITAVKIYKNRMFLTTPRYKSGVPSTLNEVPYNCDYYAPYKNTKKSPKLKPWPSWAMQKLSDCSALQFVQSMEIDAYGRIWIVDSGRTAVIDKAVNRCPPKLVIINLKRKDKIVLRYEFPPNVVSPTSTLMKDINVACTKKNNCFAFISDIFDNKLIVFDYKNKRSWSLKHPTMEPDPARANLTINGKPASLPFGIAGSALSPKEWKYENFYYTPIAGTSIYSVPTSVLKHPPKNRRLKDKHVTEIGVRSGQSDGWAMDSEGTLYFGNLPQSSVFKTQIKRKSNTLNVQQRLAQSNKDLVFPDTFSFDNYGMLALTTNKFHLYSTPDLKMNEYNFRVIRFLTKTSGYSRNRRMICRPRTCRSCS